MRIPFEFRDRAVVYGSSYGSCLAQGFGMHHPDRVAAMVLDSAMLTAQDAELSWRRAKHGAPDDGSPVWTRRRSWRLAPS